MGLVTWPEKYPLRTEPTVESERLISLYNSCQQSFLFISHNSPLVVLGKIDYQASIFFIILLIIPSTLTVLLTDAWVEDGRFYMDLRMNDCESSFVALLDGQKTKTKTRGRPNTTYLQVIKTQLKEKHFQTLEEAMMEVRQRGGEQSSRTQAMITPHLEMSTK